MKQPTKAKRRITTAELVQIFQKIAGFYEAIDLRKRLDKGIVHRFTSGDTEVKILVSYVSDGFNIHIRQR